MEEWINRGDIYEEKKHHNVIFVGRDADGIPRYAHCRGSGEITYRGDVAGSDKSYGFSYRGTDNQLFVFEAAIDLLSFIQLFPKDWKKRSYLSLGGISSVALMTFLSERPQITSVFLCLDNDQAGNEACEKLAGEISEGYSVIRLKPSRKDWNEILCDKNADRKKAIAETITIKTMAFKLGDEEGFRWVGAYEISADELLDGKEGKATETKLERGTKLIKELLADKKEISIRELDEKAKEQGISGRTMRDVRSRMKNELEYRVNEKQENSIRLKE